MTPWLRVWMRAVIGPAYRRAGAVWVGSAIVGAVIFGGNAMQPSDLTGLVFHNTDAGTAAGTGTVLAVTWLLLYLPTARMILRPDGAAYLASLPSQRIAPRAVALIALVAFQLPWLALWLLGEHARGFVVVVGWTIVIAVLALWQPRPRAHRTPRWTSGLTALTAIYARGLQRRASDALIRGIGLAVLAGLFGGLMIRNNGASGSYAAVLATCSLSIVLVPGWAGGLLPLVETRRRASWLAQSLGISRTARLAALFSIVAAIYVASVAIAIGAVELTSHTDATTFALLAGTALGSALGAACLATRAMLHADVAASDDPRDQPRRGPAAARVVLGAVAGAMVIVIALAWLDVIGTLGVLAIGFAGLATARNA